MELLLEKQEILDLGHRLRGLKVRCLSGCCWLTQDGDSRDHILRTGQSWTGRHSGKVLITATNDCRLKLVHESAQNPLPHWRQLCLWE